MNTILSCQTSEQSHVIQDFEYPPSGIEQLTSFAPVWQDSMGRQSTRAIPLDLHTYGEEQCSGESSVTKEVDAEFERGRASGYEEGRSAGRADISAELRKCEAAQVEHTLRLNEQFTFERERCIESMEPEVVKLALSIASLILRREVQIDPLLLTSSVRIALKGVAAKTSVKIHVPAATVDLWIETIDHLPNLSVKPTVVADELLENGECTLETEMGSADLGVQSQLAEIARVLLGGREEQNRSQTQTGSLVVVP